VPSRWFRASKRPCPKSCDTANERAIAKKLTRTAIAARLNRGLRNCGRRIAGPAPAPPQRYRPGAGQEQARRTGEDDECQVVSVGERGAEEQVVNRRNRPEAADVGVLQDRVVNRTPRRIRVAQVKGAGPETRRGEVDSQVKQRDPVRDRVGYV